MKRAAARATTCLFLLAAAACGNDNGGGGDQTAFCDDLQQLSDQVGGGDLDGPDQLSEVIAGLLESAPSANLQNVRDVESAINAGDDGDELGDTINDAFGDAADTCDIRNPFTPPETTTSTAPETTTTSTTEPATTTTGTGPTTTGGGVVDVSDIEVNGRVEVPGDIAAEFLDLAQACFDGDPAACDDLFAGTPVDSVDEAYGDTCAGRITPEEGQGFTVACTDLMVASIPPPADIVDTANAAACFDGEMLACDDLFNGAEPGSTDQTYGGLCAGRVQNTAAFCVDIFGDFSPL